MYTNPCSYECIKIHHSAFHSLQTRLSYSKFLWIKVTYAINIPSTRNKINNIPKPFDNICLPFSNIFKGGMLTSILILEISSTIRVHNVSLKYFLVSSFRYTAQCRGTQKLSILYYLLPKSSIIHLLQVHLGCTNNNNMNSLHFIQSLIIEGLHSHKGPYCLSHFNNPQNFPID